MGMSFFSNFNSSRSRGMHGSTLCRKVLIQLLVVDFSMHKRLIPMLWDWRATGTQSELFWVILQPNPIPYVLYCVVMFHFGAQFLVLIAFRNAEVRCSSHLSGTIKARLWLGSFLLLPPKLASAKAE